MKTLPKLLSVFVMLCVTYPISIFAQTPLQPQDAFFDQFRNYCGKTFLGKTVFPDDPGDAFAGKTLSITIALCSEQQLRIPFQVGEDQSRTWILSKTDKGLELKHDHRHADGTPDKITLYGGIATDSGSHLEQSFPADNATKKMLPEAATNIWRLTFDFDKNQLIYHLERHNKPRYTAIFQL